MYVVAFDSRRISSVSGCYLPPGLPAGDYNLHHVCAYVRACVRACVRVSRSFL